MSYISHLVCVCVVTSYRSTTWTNSRGCRMGCSWDPRWCRQILSWDRAADSRDVTPFPFGDCRSWRRSEARRSWRRRSAGGLSSTTGPTAAEAFAFSNMDSLRALYSIALVVTSEEQLNGVVKNVCEKMFIAEKRRFFYCEIRRSSFIYLFRCKIRLKGFRYIV